LLGKKNPADFPLDELKPDTGENSRSVPWVAARFDAASFPDEFHLGDGGRQIIGSYFNRPLSQANGYRVFIRGVGSGNRQVSSPFSDLLTVPAQRAAHSTIPDVIVADASRAGFGLLWIVLPVCVAVVVVLALILVIVIARKRTAVVKHPPPAMEPTKVALVPIGSAHSSDPVELRRLHFQTPAMMSHPPVPIRDFAAHVARLKAGDGSLFSQEYESIEPGQQFMWEASSAEINKTKNRYANVIAYDHSRVQLQPLDGIPGSDYINANFIDGYRRQNAYIATQGPLVETIADFWRMIWEHRCPAIVMMTKLEERNRSKCDQYWPSRGTEAYGFVHVTLLEVIELATYTVRTFQLSREGYYDKREVRQFQFTAWPDHGVPDHPTPLLLFMRRVKFMTPPDCGPLVVHCSAGVGRTGTFIVIDATLERIKHVSTVDIYGHVTCLRAQRNYMVQTEDQYVFIHDAILEAVQSGNTEILARNLGTHIQKLLQRLADGSTGLELEFRRLANAKPTNERFISANLPSNKSKNRLANLLPYESTRVFLQPIRGVEGSDYINANFIDGYRFQRAYIATQGPLAETTEDFWRMLWENNCNIVVMLTKLKEMGRDKCHQYWPSDRSARYQYFVVDPLAEYNMPQYVLREFKVTDARDGQSRTVRQFQFIDWPEQGVPTSGEGFIEFIGQVHKTKEQFGHEGPITVHCSAGVGRTGVFVALSIVLERMRFEGVVDMFQTVNMLRMQRPAMIQSEDQYAFCYHAALEYLGSFDHYTS
jgi:netrin-G3 ligand